MLIDKVERQAKHLIHLLHLGTFFEITRLRSFLARGIWSDRKRCCSALYSQHAESLETCFGAPTRKPNVFFVAR